MYKVVNTKRFKKAFKRCVKRGLDLECFKKALDILIEKGSLPPEYKPHRLSSKFNFAWECHIQSDWLLVWEQNDEELTLILIDMGTHSDIFG